jgi:hypothetical protein
MPRDGSDDAPQRRETDKQTGRSVTPCALLRQLHLRREADASTGKNRR